MRAQRTVMAVGTVPGDDCAACGVGCGGDAGNGGMQYVGCGEGEYTAVSTYRYVGYGGDFSSVRRRRDFTCLICTALIAMCLLLLAWWYLTPVDECYVDQANWEYKWGRAKQIRCCARFGIGCKNEPTPPPGPVDPFNCASGYLNWKGGWSVGKKKWCCKVHGKGCPENGEGWAAQPAAEYDCNAAYENWVKGWSMVKKTWCCNKMGKGCPGSGDQNLLQAASGGYGAGAKYGYKSAPVASPALGTMR